MRKLLFVNQLRKEHTKQSIRCVDVKSRTYLYYLIYVNSYCDMKRTIQSQMRWMQMCILTWIYAGSERPEYWKLTWGSFLMTVMKTLTDFLWWEQHQQQLDLIFTRIEEAVEQVWQSCLWFKENKLLSLSTSWGFYKCASQI